MEDPRGVMMRAVIKDAPKMSHAMRFSLVSSLKWAWDENKHKKNKYRYTVTYVGPHQELKILPSISYLHDAASRRGHLITNARNRFLN